MKKPIYLLFLMLFTTIVHAHKPDLSNFMIYEQNGKYLLLIKTSLAAFEGEVDVQYNKNAYKSPEEFKQLLLQHFQKSCLLIVNNDTIKFMNPYVVLGHESTIFAELANLPKNIHTFYVKNHVFKDIHGSQSELILLLNGLPPKQFILNEGNNYTVKLKLDNKNWIVEETTHTTFGNSKIFFWGLISIGVVGIGFMVMNRKNISSNV
jgi:hypothetical protein